MSFIKGGSGGRSMPRRRISARMYRSDCAAISRCFSAALTRDASSDLRRSPSFLCSAAWSSIESAYRWFSTLAAIVSSLRTPVMTASTSVTCRATSASRMVTCSSRSACCFASRALLSSPAAGSWKPNPGPVTSRARITALRLAFLLNGPAFDVHPDDSLRADAYPFGTANAVVCNPPFADRNWGQEELASDVRWEYGVPSRLESELAWVQHALAHAMPGGSVVMLMPPAVAARSSGRRVRADLLRRGALRAVISLPPKLAAQYALALQLWVLRHPGNEETPSHVLLIDASGLPMPGQARAAGHSTEATHVWDEVRSLVTSTWTAFNEDPGSVTAISDLALAVPVITLLDDEVDLTPGRHVRPAQLAPVSRDDLASRSGQLADMLGQLAALLPAPPFPESTGGDAIREMTLDELAQTGALFIRRAPARPADDKAEQSLPRVEGRILTGRDLARAVAPSEAGEVALDEVRNPAIREGDVLVPLVARRLTARVAAGRDVGRICRRACSSSEQTPPPSTRGSWQASCRAAAAGTRPRA